MEKTYKEKIRALALEYVKRHGLVKSDSTLAGVVWEMGFNEGLEFAFGALDQLPEHRPTTPPLQLDEGVDKSVDSN